MSVYHLSDIGRVLDKEGQVLAVSKTTYTGFSKGRLYARGAVSGERLLFEVEPDKKESPWSRATREIAVIDARDGI